MDTDKILFTTSHPAPYVDVILEKLSKYYEVDAVYLNDKSSEKIWKSQRHFEGFYDAKLSTVRKIMMVLSSSFAIIGGWGNRRNIFYMLLLVIFRRPFAIFSDVPDKDAITPAKRKLKKLFFMFVPYLFVTGPSCKDHYSRFYNLSDKKIRIFPYGVRIPSASVVERINLKREALLQEEAKINVFTANRFIDRKGYEILAEAFDRVKKLGLLDSFRVTIAGAGPLFSKYRDRFENISKEIELLGWIESEDYLLQLQHCDVYIHASIFEPYGIPVVDALMHGKLVIASDGVMAAQDFVESGSNGYIYPSNSSEALSNVLVALAENRKLVYQVGARGERVREVYSRYDHLDTTVSCIHARSR